MAGALLFWGTSIDLSGTKGYRRRIANCGLRAQSIVWRFITVKMEQAIRAIAGTFIVASVALGYFIHPAWYFFTVFVGLNLFQSAFTKWCMMEGILKKLGVSS